MLTVLNLLRSDLKLSGRLRRMSHLYKQDRKGAELDEEDAEFTLGSWELEKLHNRDNFV